MKLTSGRRSGGHGHTRPYGHKQQYIGLTGRLQTGYLGIITPLLHLSAFGLEILKWTCVAHKAWSYLQALTCHYPPHRGSRTPVRTVSRKTCGLRCWIRAKGSLAGNTAQGETSGRYYILGVRIRNDFMMGTLPRVGILVIVKVREGPQQRK